MKIIFMGTSEFAVPSLTKLINSGHNLIEIISQPDRPKGRGKKILPTPVKKVALDYNLPVYQPVKIKHPDAVKHICSLDVDCITFLDLAASMFMRRCYQSSEVQHQYKEL